MQAIVPPIEPGKTGAEAGNLVEAILFLIKEKVVRAQTSPDQPTAVTLKRLVAAARDEQSQLVYGEASQSLMKYFQVQQGLGDNLAGVVEEKTAARLNEILIEHGGIEKPEPPAFVVRGRISGMSRPVPDGLKVVAYDRDLRRWQKVGECILTASGDYRINYSGARSERAEKGAADLVIRVIARDGSTRGESTVRFNAGTEEVIDLNLVLPQVCDWERLTSTVVPLLEGQDVLPEALIDADLDFIVAEAGLERDQLQDWVSARQCALAQPLTADALTPGKVVTAKRSARASAANHPGNPANQTSDWRFYFAWARELETRSVEQVFARTTPQLLEAVQRAVEANLIPAALAEQVEKLAEAINRVRADLELKPAAPGTAAKLGDLLNVVRPDWLGLEQRRKVVELVARVDPSAQDFEAHARKVGLADQDARVLTRTLRLAKLSANNLPLVAALDPLLAEDRDASLSGLTRLSIGQWLDLAHIHDSSGGQARAAVENAFRMRDVVENSAPELALRARIDAGDVNLVGKGFASISRFLANNPKFSITDHDVEEVLESANLDGIEEPAEEIGLGLRQLQALKRAGVRWDETPVFIEAGLGSIEALAEHGRAGLRKRLGSRLDGGRIDVVAQAAMTMKMAGVGLLNQIFPMMRNAGTEVMQERRLGEKAQKFVDGSPSLRRLFGALERCACDPCQSVLSPSAYLVDLLNFVGRDNGVSWHLQQRRADIYDLELSCDNAQIELPHIDLVNEILENAVALPIDIEFAGVTDPVALLRQRPIAPQIFAALQSTTWEPLVEATMMVEVFPDERGGVSRAVISDRYRRWGLELRAGYFGTAESGRNLATLDAEIVAAVLDQGRPPQDPDGTFTNYLADRARGIGKLPLRVENLRVNPIVPGKRWEISYTAAGQAAIDDQAQSLRLAADEGAATEVRMYSAAALHATRAAFGNQALGGMMLADTHDSSNYFVVPIDANHWHYSKDAREVMVFFPAGISITSLSYQCTARDRDLATRPQHRNPRAYRDFLARPDAVYPWTLPFDVDLSETRALLDAAGIGRAMLMQKALPPDGIARHTQFAIERLGMSRAELDLAASTASSDAVWKIWGLKVANGQATIFDSYDETEKGGTPLELLTVVSVVLQQARLEFTELEWLLRSQFVNPGNAVRIELADGADSAAECDPTQLRLAPNSAALLDRLHRFARWKRRLGWSVPELDFALRSTAGGTAEQLAERLDGIEVMRARLGIPVEILLTAFCGFDRTSYSERSGNSVRTLEPLYERTFQNLRTALAGSGAGVTRSVDPELAFARITDAASTLTLGDRIAVIAACVGLRAHDVLPLLNGDYSLRPAQPTATSVTRLSIDHLRKLVSYAALARALHISPTRLAALLDLFGSRPFESPRTLDEFCSAVDFISAAGAEGDRLRYVLTHRGPQSYTWVFTAERGRLALIALQRALLAATEQIDTGTSVEIPADSLTTLLNNATSIEMRLSIVGQITQLARSHLERVVLSLWPVVGNAFTTESRVRELVDVAVKWQRRVAIVVPSLAQAVGVDAPLVQELLWHHLRGLGNAAAMELFADPKSRGPEQRFENPQRNFELSTVEAQPEFRALLKLYKFGLLNAAWRLTLGDLARFPGSVLTSQVMAGLSFDALPVAGGATQFEDWRRSTALLKLTRARRGLSTVVDDYTRAIWQGGADPVAAGAAVWSEALDLSPASLRELAGTGVLEFGATGNALLDCREPLRLVAWYELMVLARRHALSGQEVRLLIAESPGRTAIDVAVRALQSHFGEPHWREQMAKAANALRSEQRDRLVDYLRWRDGLRDADGLYERYLIDPQMAPCMNTTRLLQATAAIQLFVQRCLMKLETNVDPAGADPDRQWEWRKNYRVWEANRKIFLFPENWLHPELRDDKSEIFRAFESALLQTEASDANAANAARGYLDALVDVAHISVMGMYEETPRANSTGVARPGHKTLHVVGRSPDPPYTYFYRGNRCNGEAGSRWTPWERITLDLPSCHVVPFVMGGELHLVWPIVELERDAQANKEFYNITLAWARRSTLGWTKRKVAMESATRIEKHFKRDERGSLALKLNEPLSAERRGVVDLYVARKSPSVIDEASLNPNRIVVSYEPGRAPGPKDDKVVTDISRWTFSARALVKYLDTGRIDWVEARYTIIGLRLAGLKDPAEAIGSYIFGENAGPDQARTPPPPEQGYPADGTPVELSIYNYYASIIFEAKATIEGVPFTITTGAPLMFYDATFQGVGSFTANLMFEFVKDPDFDDPGVNEFARVKMDRVGSFWFETGRDTRWILDPNHAPLQMPEETLSWESRLRERDNFRPGTSAGLSDVARTVFAGSRTASNYLALRAAGLGGAAGKPDTWYWEESVAGTTSRFVALVGADDPGTRIAVQPGGFEDASEYRYRYSAGRDELFTPDSQEAPANTRFGVDSVIQYFPSGLPAGIDARVVPLLPFHLGMPYGSYNWEVFYHLPMAAARFLATQQRYEDAQRWYSYVFNPTTNDPATGRERYWRCLPLRHANTPLSIEQLVRALADPGADPSVKHMMEDQVAASIANPFSPFAIARGRNSAYEWYAVIAYIRNLIEWGDSLFRRDTRESINEAAMLYVFAAKILGRRPEIISKQGYKSPALSYRALAGRWDSFGNAWARLIDTPAGRVIIAILIKFKQAIGGYNPYAFDEQIAELASMGALYFCVPQNDRLLELWDAVADRLWKIRHCQNIDGIRRPLALLDPPIDPELLIRARLAGVSIDDVLADLYAPSPSYRYGFLAQKAVEICNELKNLGASLLSAIEKKDVEQLALLRQTQEIEMLGLVEAVRLDQVSAAEADIAALNQSRQNTVANFRYLQRLLGNSDIRFDAQGVPILDQHGSLQIRDAEAPAGFRGLGLIQSEVDQISSLQDAHTATLIAGAFKAASALAHATSAVLYAYGDSTKPAAEAARAVAMGVEVGSAISELVASDASNSAEQSDLMATFERRREDWIHKSALAVNEIRQIDRQIIATQVRRDISLKELANHRRSLAHARDIDDYLRQRKFSNAELLAWMETQLLAAYHGAYQLAFDLAKRAERAWRRETGESNSNWIRYGYWDGARKGLLAGEQLGLDLQRMQIGYLERNKREYEITRHVSVATLDPAALVELRENSTCTVSIPESLFDLDFPGHYFRRLKLVSVSLPCVVGPYASVPLTLKLLKSSVRIKADATGGYARIPGRFEDIQAGAEAVVMSTGQNDTGLFEANMRDDRYLPFENAGAISTWQLDLPADFRAFDYATISDVILHLRYTAREGGDDLKLEAVNVLQDSLNSFVRMDGGQGLTRMFSLRQDFPAEWHRLMNPADLAADTSVDIPVSRGRFPYLFGGANVTMTVESIDMYVVPRPGIADAEFPAFVELTPPDADDEEPVEWGVTPSMIGPLFRNSATTNKSVAPDEAAAMWRVTIPSAENATFRRDFGDLMLVFHYSLG